MINHANPKQCAKIFNTKLIVALAMVSLPVLSWADAGNAIFVLGDVKVMSKDGSEHSLIKGGVVNEGDTIITTSKGQVQLKMQDGGLIAVRPDSKFRIDEYVFENDVEKDKDVFSLMKGSFRSVTGTIGHKNKGAYKVKTPVATIGIRGTDYTARLCSSDCASASDGLYVGVMSGGIYLMNEVAILDVSPGEYGYVESVYAAPVYLEQVPGDLLFAQGSTTQKPAEVAIMESSSTPLMVAGIEPLVTPELLAISNPLFAISQSGVSMLAHSVTTDVAVVDGTYASNEISWGHWNSNFATVDGNIVDVSNATWIKGQELDQTAFSSKSGTIDYAVSGGTLATASTIGVQSYSSFTAHFDPVATLDISLSVGTTTSPSQDWTASQNGTLIDKTNGTFNGVFANISGPQSIINTGGNFSGGFVGDANSAIVAYAFGGDTVADGINHQFSGTVAFQAP